MSNRVRAMGNSKGIVKRSLFKQNPQRSLLMRGTFIEYNGNPVYLTLQELNRKGVFRTVCVCTARKLLTQVSCVCTRDLFYLWDDTR